jgi:hypothetical protein
MVQKFATPVEQATTPSLEALHAFSLGVKTKDITGDEAAIPLFEEAIKLDPSFAMAYALLGTSYSNLEERSRGAGADEELRKLSAESGALLRENPPSGRLIFPARQKRPH